ncbi:ice-binding family protein [Sphaerisporangium sp. TRM90804]|uniref:ice-binding family protein n=1 Tax=Sphaerisporangium sp. TRM90804 TaxID=3031113 RepID=UPI00244A7954|nr:ice-binding family protein [Sphaerisporangium sp. TRM90804]MDH2425982.1 ice-binding family protein [Sphaerisporangium sp. TRM90804]
MRRLARAVPRRAEVPGPVKTRAAGGSSTGAARPRSALFRLAVLALAPVASMLIATQSSAVAPQPPVDLGTAGDFAVLAGSTVTNTGATVVTGDLGLSPGTAVTGFPPGTVTGTIHAADAAAAQAKADLVAAYDDAAARTPATTVPTQLGGTTLTPGLYDSAAGTFQITGNLTLDAQGDPGAVWIFQTASTLVTASAGTVTLVGGAQSANVFWQVGSSATLGTGSSLAGNVLALTSITVTTGASVDGRVLARDGAVTLDANTVTRPAGALFISVPETANLGSATAGAARVSGRLGGVTVTDTRGGADTAWTATVSSTDLTTGGGTAAETIAKALIGYAPGPATATTGDATFTPGTAGDLGSARTAFSVSGAAGDNSATWDPLITVTLPAGVVAGTYTAVITHSVV